MRAAVSTAFKAPLVVEDLRIAEPGPDEVLVRVHACAICHSDLTFIEGGWGGTLPAVWGHEAAGDVVAVGSNCGLGPGSRVLVTMIRACGTCRCCSAGQHGLCAEMPPREGGSPLRRAEGTAVTAGLSCGAFAEMALVHRSQTAVLPEDLPFDLASLLACGVMTGWGAVANSAGVLPGQSVAVVGCGGVGMSCIQAAAIHGADPVVAVDLSPERLDAAARFGATHGASPVDAAETVSRATGGRMADVVLIAAGARPAIEQAVSLLAPMGKAVIVGIPPSGVMAEIDPVAINSGALTIMGSKLHAVPARDVPTLIGHWRDGRLDLQGLVTRHFPLTDINAALDTARRGEGLRTVVMMES